MKNALFIFLLLSAYGCGSKPLPKCQNEDECLNNHRCQCWCSEICSYRDKLFRDHPIYIRNDPNGKFCYCKQWDLDHYEDNCILHKHLEEPFNPK